MLVIVVPLVCMRVLQAACCGMGGICGSTGGCCHHLWSCWGPALVRSAGRFASSPCSIHLAARTAGSVCKCHCAAQHGQAAIDCGRPSSLLCMVPVTSNFLPLHNPLKRRHLGVNRKLCCVPCVCMQVPAMLDAALPACQCSTFLRQDWPLASAH